MIDGALHRAKAPPATRRGQATRKALVAGARRVFERDGFVDARIADISKESGVATGSFYTYFADKDEALAAVFAELQEEMMHPQLARGEGRRAGRGEGRGDSRSEGRALVSDGIAASHRAYLETYRDNARLMALREQVAAVDGVFRDLRQARAREFVGRNARMIERLQAAGQADPGLDPELTAMSLSGMVARAAYGAFVLRDGVDMDHLVGTLTRLWMNALQIPTDAIAPRDSGGSASPAPRDSGSSASPAATELEGADDR